MKKLLLLLLIAPVFGFGQEPEYKFENNIMVVVFQADSLNANEIQSKATAAIANIYKSAQNVVQLNDKDSNKIIIKALTEVPFDNPMKPAYPKNNYIPTGYVALVDYNINLDFKDGRYRLVYELTNSTYKDLTMRSYSSQTMFNPTFFAVGDDDEVKQTLEDAAKQGMMGAKRKEKYISGYFNARDNWHSSLMLTAKNIANALNDEINNNTVSENSILNDDF